jgi:hypothetical protein
VGLSFRTAFLFVAMALNRTLAEAAARRNGLRATQHLPNGDTYAGEWLNDVKHGAFADAEHDVTAPRVATDLSAPPRSAHAADGRRQGHVC